MHQKQLPTGIEIRNEKLRLWFRWEGERYYEPSNLTPTPANAATLGRLRSEIVSKIKLGAFDAREYLRYFPDSNNVIRHQNDPLFVELAQAWLDGVEVSPATRNSYKKSLNNYWLPIIGHIPVRSIRASDIKSAIKQNEFNTAKTRNNALIPLRGTFQLAVEDELIPNNPTATVKNLKHQKPLPDPFTFEEREAIMAHIERLYHPIYAAYFGLAFYAGLRSPSEMSALKWSSVDLRAGIVRVERKIDDLGKVREETKTSSIRDVVLSDEGLYYLKLAKPYTFLRNDFVFINPLTDTYFMTGKAQRRVWSASLKKLGIRARGMNQTRHTVATQCIMAAQNPYFIAKQLGHSVQMTLTVYSKWINEQGDQAEMSKLRISCASKTEKDAK